ncbi:MAG TPA: DNA replication and repair protein RecF [bacterium]|nr:DNA replication and repair protein RecF [bacterium]
MVIREFGAIHFRNYRELFVNFSEGINLFIGDNGQGKTNLAEAIYFLSHLGSFRTHRLDPLLTFGEAASWLQGTVLKPDFETKARVEITRRGRRVWLDDQPVATLSAYAALFYAVLFNPDSLYSYRHYPAARRAEFDRFLSFLDPDYLEALRNFRTIQMQKNGLLKGGDLSSLPDWNHLFIEKASGIIKRRAALLERLNGELPALFALLTGRDEALRLVYEPSLTGNPAQDEATLARVTEQERLAGHAMYGPHRDDVQLVLDQRKESYFSQGEYRVSLLALKLALNGLLSERRGSHPVIILDDLFSELDASVQGRLLEYLKSMPNQIFITTTQVPPTLQIPGVQIMEIREGRIV